uniref:Uncharacterized protein n=1 Tax=Panagrolaimus sp. PS1159 TaxID=55785 RepID=A0AC35GT28_9BILA
MYYYFQHPLPSQQHRRYARDRRQIYPMMNGEGFRNSYQSTPQYFSSPYSRSTSASPYNNPAASPYSNPAASPFNDFRPTSSSQYRNTQSTTASPLNNVQATPKSPFFPATPSTPFISSSFPTSRSTSKIIDPVTFNCFDFEHPDLAAAFYQTFKAFPQEYFTHEVRAKCVKVLKYVLSKERSENYRQKCDQLCLDLRQKEKQIQDLRINRSIAEEAAIQARIQVEVQKFKSDIDKLRIELWNEKTANDGLQKQLQKKNYDARQSYGNLENENRRLQEEIGKLMQQQHDFIMLKKEIKELKEKNMKLESEAEKNLEAEQNLEALATSAKSCDLLVTKQRKERMCAEIQAEKILRLTAQNLLKIQENENEEIKNKNKIYEERIGILEEQLKKAESVGHKRAAETYEDVAPKRAKTREEMRQDLYNFVGIL